MAEPISVDASQPMYAQLETQLRHRIESGEWQPGNYILSEAELCRAYDVSRVTVRHALRRLAEHGLIVRQQGKGSYVRPQSLTAGTRSVRSFTAEVMDLGMKPTSQLISVTEMAAPDQVCSALALDPGTAVFRICRIRLGDGDPIGVQTAFLPADRFPGFLGIDLADQSLYQVLERHYGIRPNMARETFLVGVASTVDADQLKMQQGAPVFQVVRTTFTDDYAFEYVESTMRGDRYRVTIAIRNP